MILVPAATSPAKTTQVRAYGATIDLVTGSRDDVADEAIRRSAEIPYASHSWHPMFLQGVKTIGYEIWESLGFTAPDNIVSVAAPAASSSAAIWPSPNCSPRAALTGDHACSPASRRTGPPS